MLHAKALSLYFWTDALNTAYHIHNRISLRLGTSKTNYELWKGRKPNFKYFNVFRSSCHILGDREVHRKQDSKSDRGIFLVYSTNNRAYKVYNQQTRVVMESINVVINDYSNDKRVDDDDEIQPFCATQTSSSNHAILGTEAPSLADKSNDNNATLSSSDKSLNRSTSPSVDLLLITPVLTIKTVLSWHFIFHLQLLTPVSSIQHLLSIQSL